MRIIFSIALALFLAGCSTSEPAGRVLVQSSESSAQHPSFAQTEESVEAMASRFLRALAEKDEAELRALSIDQQEFNRLVWPHLPSSRPETNLTPEYVWSQYHPRNELALRKLLERHGGKSYRLLSAHSPEQPTEYPAFRIHPRIILEVEDAGGERKKLRLFGSVVEQSGRFKIYGFVV